MGRTTTPTGRSGRCAQLAFRSAEPNLPLTRISFKYPLLREGEVMSSLFRQGDDSDTRRAQNRLRTLDLNDEDRAFILELFFEGAGRKVGTYALDNVIVAHYSKKCRDVRYLESHTVEQTFAFQLELDPDVVAYVCQVTCRGVRRGRHVSMPTRTSSSSVVNQWRWWSASRPLSWKSSFRQAQRMDCGRWAVSNLIYEAWAEAHGVTYRVWTSPRVNGTHHRIFSSWFITGTRNLASFVVKDSMRCRSNCTLGQEHRLLDGAHCLVQCRSCSGADGG